MERAQRSRADRCLPTASTPRQSHQPACGVILDSDVLIEVLRGNAQTARWVAAEASTGEGLRYSPVSRVEIGAGMRAKEEMGIAALFAGLDSVTIDATTGALAGERLRELSDLLPAEAHPHRNRPRPPRRPRHRPHLRRAVHLSGIFSFVSSSLRRTAGDVQSPPLPRDDPADLARSLSQPYARAAGPRFRERPRKRLV